MTEQLKPLTEAETAELLDWVSACQSSYHIDSTPGHRFGGLGSQLQENRDALVEYVNSLIAARAQPAQAVPVPVLSDEEMEAVIRPFYRDSYAASMAMLNGIDEYRAVEQAVRAKMGVAGWLPIETAPKDGTSVLIFQPSASRRKVMEVYWAKPWDGAPDEQCWWSTPHGPAGRGYTILPTSVTHWMPLPAAPQQKGGA